MASNQNELKYMTGNGVMSIKVMDITPHKAAQFLNHNTHNRTLRAKRVAVYKSEMTAGNWKSNGMPIIFGSDGSLKDGQHRLKACVDSNKTMKDVIVVKLPKEQANCYDIGGQRTARDIAKFEGLDDTPFFRSLNMYATVNTAISGNCWAKSYSKFKLVQEMQKHYDACEFVYSKIYLATSARRNSKTRRSSVAAAIFNAYLQGYDKQKLERFCEVLNYGLNQNENEKPIIALIDNMLLAKEMTKQERTKMYLQCQAALKAFEDNRTDIDWRKANKEYYAYPK